MLKTVLFCVFATLAVTSGLPFPAPPVTQQSPVTPAHGQPSQSLQPQQPYHPFNRYYQPGQFGFQQPYQPFSQYYQPGQQPYYGNRDPYSRYYQNFTGQQTYNPYSRYNQPGVFGFQHPYYRNNQNTTWQHPYDTYARYNQNPTGQQWAILRQTSNQSPEGNYQYSYKTENGIDVEEQGQVYQLAQNEVALRAQGSYSYTSPEGEPVSVTYVADETGYHPTGSHIPEIPEAIQRSLAWNAAHQDSEHLVPTTYRPSP